MKKLLFLYFKIAYLMNEKIVPSCVTHLVLCKIIPVVD